MQPLQAHAYASLSADMHDAPGLLPPRASDMQLELARAKKQLDLCSVPLDKYTYLMALQV